MLEELGVAKVIVDCNKRDFIIGYKWPMYYFQLANLVYVEFIVVKGTLQIKIQTIRLYYNNYAYIHRLNFGIKV